LVSLVLILLLLLVSLTVGDSDFETEVTYDGRSLIIDGHRKILFSGSIHYPRSTPQVINSTVPFQVPFSDSLMQFIHLLLLCI